MSETEQGEGNRRWKGGRGKNWGQAGCLARALTAHAAVRWKRGDAHGGWRAFEIKEEMSRICAGWGCLRLLTQSSQRQQPTSS